MVGCVFPCRKRITGRRWTDDVHLGGGTIGGGVPQKWGTGGYSELAAGAGGLKPLRVVKYWWISSMWMLRASFRSSSSCFDSSGGGKRVRDLLRWLVGAFLEEEVTLRREEELRRWVRTVTVLLVLDRRWWVRTRLDATRSACLFQRRKALILGVWYGR